MCWVQEIHEVFCPDLVFDVAGQEHHVCSKAYPAPAPGEPDVRCPLHSCCRVTTELVSECAAVREARAASEGQGEGKEGEREDFSCGDQENSAYREIVFIAIDERNGKGPVVWENTADRSRGQALMGPWEVLWDAADDEGYACESGPASRKGSSATNTKGAGRNSGTGFLSGDDYDYSDDDDGDDEDQEADFVVESPYMEFWTFGAADDSGGDGSGGKGLYTDVATEGGVGGKVFVCFEDPIDSLELQTSGDRVLGKWGDAGTAGKKKQGGGERERKSWFSSCQKDGSDGSSGGWWWKKKAAMKGARSA